MMKAVPKLLFVSRRDDRPDFDTAFSMRDRGLAVAPNATEIDACFLEDIAFLYDGLELKLHDVARDSPIESYDAIFMFGWFKTKQLEDIALALAVYAEHKRIPFYNSEARHNRSRTKLSQYVFAAVNGVAMVPFIFLHYGQTIESLLDKADISYPFILKSAMASRGRDNYLVQSSHQLSEIIKQNPEIPYVAQAFVPNEGDYRVIVLGGKVSLVMHRKSVSGSHINNTSQGGQATLVDPAAVSPQLLSDSVTISRLLNREITGVDMIVHRETGQHYFLEANNMPQLSTGSFVDEKMRSVMSFLAGAERSNGRSA